MCDCVQRLNDALEKDGSNTMIEVPILFNVRTGIHHQDEVKICTVKRDPSKREKPKSFFATFCPFCGQRYPGHGEDETQVKVQGKVQDGS